MSDVVVTVPQGLWAEWLTEGDNADDPREEGIEYGFNLYGPRPQIKVGDRVYIVAHGRLRGFAPLVNVEENSRRFGGRGHGFALIRRGAAVAVTINEPIRGFQGWRYRWWELEAEQPFPGWKTP